MNFNPDTFQKKLEDLRKYYNNELNRIGNHVPAHLTAVVPVIGMNTIIELVAKLQVALKDSMEGEPTANEKQPEEPVKPQRGRPRKEEGVANDQPSN